MSSAGTHQQRNVWPTKALGELLAFLTSGSRGWAQHYADSGDVFLRIQNVGQNSLRLDDVAFVAAPDTAESRRTRVQAGDVLLSITADLGRTAVVPATLGNAYINQHLAILRLRNAEPRFVSAYLSSPDGQAQIQGRNRQGVKAGLNFDDINSFRVPVPPLDEQRRIAEVLDGAEALRAKRRAALALLDTLTQSIFLDLFGDPIANIKRFPVQPMIDLIDPARPLSYGILMPGPDQAEGVKYVRVVDMKQGGIDLAGVRRTTEKISNAFRRSLLKPGDLLMSIRGHVGRFAVVPRELDGANITQDTARLAVVGCSSVFVRECLRSLGFQRWMAKHTKGVAVRGINLGDVKLMPIIVPPAEMQNSFAEKANAVEKLKSAQRSSLAELDALFASLQHRAFRGEL